MLLLLLVGFVGGLVTGISPCVLPVLPIVLAGVAGNENRRRPYLIVAGLVLSFSALTLVGGALLSALGLPADLLRNLGIVVLVLVAAGLIVPGLGALLDRPFARMGLKRQPGAKGGFMLGASLGLVYVPCAGPVLAAIVVSTARHRIGLSTVLVTLSYALGNAVPLLGIALAGRHASNRVAAFRAHAPRVRRVAGVIMAATAVALFFNVFQGLQTHLPGYASAVQNRLEGSALAKRQLDALTGSKHRLADTATASLVDDGPAPDFQGIAAWLNTGGDPLSLSKLKGHVVLVDFWTYSCINCLRSLPHVQALYRTYRSLGLVVIGVHSPEFAFEHVVSNVKAATARLGVVYPVAIDNDFGTWNAYQNEYWPAEYLIDSMGHIRHTHFGEGDYAGTEAAIRALLAQNGAVLPAPTEMAASSAGLVTTLETYLGYSRLDRYTGSPIRRDASAGYAFPKVLAPDHVSLAGTWTVGAESITAGRGARIRLRFSARQVYLVLGGKGTVSVTLNGIKVAAMQVGGYPRTYTIVTGTPGSEQLLEVNVSEGIQAYDFTFG